MCNNALIGKRRWGSQNNNDTKGNLRLPHVLLIMERMSNHEYDQQYRRHMDKVQRQAQYISDLLRYTSLQDQVQAHAPHRQYHSRHNSGPPPRHLPYSEDDEQSIHEIVVPVKSSPKPLKPILRRTVSSNATTQLPQQQRPAPIPKRPVSANPPILKNRLIEEPKDPRRVRIQDSHHIAYYPQDAATDDEDDDEEEEEEEEEELYYEEHAHYRQPTNQYQYHDESEEDYDESDSYSDEELYERTGPTWHRPAPPQAPAVDNSARPYYPTSRLNEYLNSTAMHMPPPPSQVYAGSDQSTPVAASPNNVTSILERFFTAPNAPAPSSTMSTPLSAQEDAYFQTSPQSPSYSSSTTVSNSSTSKGFLSSIFRKSPGPAAVSNIITTRAMSQRPNSKRNDLLSEHDVAEIRELTKYEQLNGGPASATPAKDRNVMKLASMSQVWCFRIWSQQQPEDGQDIPVWTAFDYSNQRKLTKGLHSHKECLFHDSHIQGDVMVLPAHNTGHVATRGRRVMLEVRQLDVEPDTKFVYREGVAGTRWK